MRVAVLPEFGAWSASTRYRALQHVPRLRELLGSVDVFLPDDRPQRHPGRVGQVRFFGSHGLRYVRRWAEVRSLLDGYDAVLVQRSLYPMGPAAVARPLSSYTGKVVLDLDDAVFDVKPSMSGRGRAAQWLYGPQQARYLLERADGLIVSTAALRSSVARRRISTVVLPTVPDPDRYAVSDQRTVNRRVVWAGTVGGLTYLDPLRDVFRTLREESRGSLTVISSAPWDGPSDFEPWNLEGEFDSFVTFAAGVMPLPDVAYTRAKAGFKLLQYMAAGLPVVASPVGVNVELVETSGAGFLAESTADWTAALRELLDDVDLRVALGAKGRAFVRSYADMPGQAEEIARMLSS